VPLDEHGNVALSLACLLVGVGDRRILIDTGFGAGTAQWGTSSSR
jgi:hypothetical protein